MALTRIKTWVSGQVLTAGDLNAEFDNIIDNAISLVQPWVGNLDMDGNTIILDGDADTSIDAATDDTIDISIAGADDFRITANTFTALSGSSLVVANGNITSTVGNLTVTDGQTTLADPGSHTNTVVTPLIVESTTSGTPAAGIGTGILFKSESQDENPSNFGQIEFAATDITTGSEDTYFQVLTRVAGAALTAVYRFVATGAFKGIFTHANSADRTYTLPNYDAWVGVGEVFRGPSSMGSGSTRTIETFSSGTGNLDGIHFYSGAFTLDSGHTLTVQATKRRVVIISDTSITINGTITASGAGATGGTSAAGGNGTDQPGGGGGNNGGTAGDGGAVVAHGITLQAGGANGNPGAAGTQITGSDVAMLFNQGLTMLGGAGGGGGDGGGFAGGDGGGSIVLIAPTVTLGATSTLNTSGTNGGGAGGAGTNAGSGGGGGGNILIITRAYTDSGCTFTMTGGSGGTGQAGNPYDGGAGATGVKQILIFA